jgi:hypothetical protein
MNIRANPVKQYTLSGLGASAGLTKRHLPSASGGVQLRSTGEFRWPPGACRNARFSGFRVQGSWFRVQGSGLRVQGSGFRVHGSGFRVVPLVELLRFFVAPCLGWLVQLEP